jgi:CheY-like chemotaxis protein
MFNASPSAPQSSRPARVRSVLILEDDGLISLTMELTARELGAERVEVFGSPAEASRAAEQGTFDCAILDVYVGTGESFAVADILAGRNIPFLFCTGLSQRDIVERHRHRPLLGKPYSEDDLRASLLRIVEG